MASYERIIIVGNLGNDPKIAMVGEQKVANFSVAVNRKRGEQQTTTWYSCAAWNGRAELVEKYLKRGNRVMIEGSNLRVVIYFDKQGQPQPALELTVDSLTFIDAKPTEEEQPSAKGTEDIPF